jgi:hypothetical protein
VIAPSFIVDRLSPLVGVNIVRPRSADAALRALHVDTSHAPRSAGQDEGTDSCGNASGRVVVAGGSIWRNPRTPYEQPTHPDLEADGCTLDI